MSAPNAVLAAALHLIGWSNGETARRINARASELGYRQVAVHVSTVGRWINGGRPRDPVPRILADLISTALGARVSPEQLHLRGDHQAQAGPITLTVVLTAAEADIIATAAERTRQNIAQYLRASAVATAQGDVAPQTPKNKPQTT